MKTKLALLLPVLLALTLAPAGAAVRYVNLANPSPAPPYTNWASAATNIQDAIDAANAGDEIVVTNGVYATGGRALTGGLINRVAVTKPVTVRSLNGPAVTEIRGYQMPETTNGYGAVRCVYLANDAKLLGFTLTHGATIDSPYDFESWSGAGGGVFCASVSEMVSNCVFSGNSAIYGGGAFRGTLYNCAFLSNSVFSKDGSGPRGGGAHSSILNNCTLTGNFAYAGGGAEDCTLNDCALTGNSAYGGGGADDCTLNNCILTGNSAFGGGGAGYCTLNNCILTGNSAGDGGGATSCTLNACTLTGNSASNGGGASNSTLNNCNLMSNSADSKGGGAAGCNLNNCSLTSNSAGVAGGGIFGGALKNCTVTGNSAGETGGGVSGLFFCSALCFPLPSTLTNCIVYFNHAPTHANCSMCILTYSCTTPLPDGIGNIDADPRFVDLVAGDLRLRSSSPCINAGNNANDLSPTDLDDNPRVVASFVDIGAYEYQLILPVPVWPTLQASYTNVSTGFTVDFNGQIAGHPDPESSCWDFGDGMVISNRLGLVSHSWATPGDYAVVLRAYNGDHPDGVSAVVIVRVVTQPIHYVDGSAGNPAPPFASWATAAGTIQDAVDAATVPGALVLVTNGTYSTGGRAVYGTMTNRVAVTQPVIVRSVNGPDMTVIRGYQVANTTNGDGSIRCVYLASRATLAGFTLRDGASWEPGGGVWCESTKALVSNCTLAGNSSQSKGGGAAGGTLNNCTLTGNVAYTGGGAAEATLNNCTLSGNSAQFGGGARLGTLNNCTLSGNSAIGNAGGASDATLNNCTLLGNSAQYGGGAAGGTLNSCTLTGNSAQGVSGGSHNSTLNNCTLTGNSASRGGGASDATLNNCIVYYNTALVSGGNSENSILNYSCTTPLPANGVGNFTNPPLFVNQAGGNLRLQTNSPCINAGRNADAPVGQDLDGNPRIAGGTVDIGAYEFQNPASTLSYAWLQQFRLPTAGSADFADPDGDRFNNFQEWRAGTDPTNGSSALRLLTPSFDGSNWLVSWQSVPERTYTVERSDNLSMSNSFLPLTTAVPGQSRTTTVIDTNSTALGATIYRVRVEE